MGVEPIYTALQAVLAFRNQRVSSAPHFAPHEFAVALIGELVVGHTRQQPELPMTI
jgi:hypothetical protein